MALNYNLKSLQDNEIAGKQTINPIVGHLQGMHSLSEFMTITPNGQGSVNFDLDVKSIIDVILGMVKTQEALQCSFRGSVNGNTLTVSSGHVHFPDANVSISGGTFSVGQTVHIALTGSTSSISGQLATGNVTSVMTSATTMLLPLMTTVTVGGETYPMYYHVGDYVFANRPMCWCAGYDASKEQALTHGINAYLPTWTEIGECEEEA